MKQNENVGKRKKWSIMVYMAGGDDVSDEARDSLLRMKQVGSTEHFHLIAQFDTGREGSSTKRYYLTPFEEAETVEKLLKAPCQKILDSSLMAYPMMNALAGEPARSLCDMLQDEKVCKRLEQHPDSIRTLVLDCILARDLDADLKRQTNSGDPDVLGAFIQWGIERYPADYKMVIIWGHGNGFSVAWDASPLMTPRRTSTELGLEKPTELGVEKPTELGAPEEKPTELGGPDEKPAELLTSSGPDSLTLVELRKAFEIRGQGADEESIHIVGFNSCLMGMIEVCRQLSGAVQIAIGSEGLTPNTSWPYHTILGVLKRNYDRNFEMDPRSFAEMIVEEYAKYYSKEYERNPKKGIDLSACDLEATQGLVNAMRELVKLLLEKLKEEYPRREVLNAIMAAHLKNQDYFNSYYADLYDFCDLLRNSCHDDAVQERCQNVMSAVKKMAWKNEHKGNAVRHSYGVSIYFPWEDDATFKKYRGLEFINDTGWREFLELYLKRLGQSRDWFSEQPPVTPKTPPIVKHATYAPIGNLGDGANLAERILQVLEKSAKEARAAIAGTNR
ncbi:MAG: clostripain-related cysteine peptidase [Acidobacteria bacterium]|nr:clostripain-related cysteine peptidase [Acidobacteriota bacterium]